MMRSVHIRLPADKEFIDLSTFDTDTQIRSTFRATRSDDNALIVFHPSNSPAYCIDRLKSLLTRNNQSHDGSYKQFDMTYRFTQIKAKPSGFRKLMTAEEKPYILFHMRLDNESHTYLAHPFVKKLSTLGLRYRDEQHFAIEIVGKRNVFKAIELFQQEPYYENLTNQKLHAYLSDYQEKCKKVSHDSVPLKSKAESRFKLFEETGPSTLSESRHRVYLVTKQSDPEEKLVYKENTSGSAVSELEAYNGFCYRLLLGNRHPKISGVHNAKGERVAVVMAFYEIFQPFQGYLSELNAKEIVNLLLKAEAAKVWAAAYFRKENDLHAYNYGIGPDGYFVKIDDDQSSWPLTCRYVHLGPLESNPDRGYPIAPVDAFPLTVEDISTLATLIHAHPHNWPDRCEMAQFNFAKLLKHDKFHHDKYYIFLKAILCSRDTYEAIARATISSEKLRKKQVDLDDNSTKELKEILSKMPAFQSYLAQHRQIIEQIIDEFEEYNLDYPKEKDAYLRIDTHEIRKRFNKLYFSIVPNHLHWQGFFSQHAAPKQQSSACNHDEAIKSHHELSF